MSHMPTHPEPIALVTPGRLVVDPAGEEVGRVTQVAMGDPNAVTVQEPPGDPGVLGDRLPHPGHGEEPDVPPDVAARLLRAGYLKVDRRGLFKSDCYVGADQIAEVRQDTVELLVGTDQLPTPA